MASRGQWHFTFLIQCHSLKKWTPSITKHELSGVESTWGILFKVCHANLHKNFSSPFLIAFFLFFMGGVGKPIAASAPGSVCEHLTVGKLHRGFLHSSTQGLFASCWMEPLSSQCKGQGRMMRCTVWPSSMKAESQLTWGPQISNSPWVNLRGGFYNEKGWDRGRRRKEKNRITSGKVISVATNGSFPLVFFLLLSLYLLDLQCFMPSSRCWHWDDGSSASEPGTGSSPIPRPTAAQGKGTLTTRSHSPGQNTFIGYRFS